ncbi:MAG: hypothetical protein MHPSP_000428, partial [Paramarteilia canceri]
YAVKFEEKPKEGRKPVLYYDQQFLFFLSKSNNCKYVPTMYHYGTDLNYCYLLMELLGPSIMDVFNAINLKNQKMSPLTLIYIARGMLLSIQAVHENRIIHRDIKPNNFCWGSRDYPNRIYILDFGLSKQFIIQGIHIPLRNGKELTGTARYVSINTHMGYEQSRRDDLEALTYVFIYMFRGGTLPWIGIKCDAKREQFFRIGQMKKNITLAELCQNCPFELQKILNYTRKLRFEMRPNYDHLLDLVCQIAKKQGLNLDSYLRFEWDYDPNVRSRLSSHFARINPIISHGQFSHLNGALN